MENKMNELGFPTVDWNEGNPTNIFEFIVVENDEVESLKSIRLRNENCKFIHLEMLSDENISLIAASKVVEYFELSFPDIEISWNITKSKLIKPSSIVVCCVNQN